MSVDINAQDVLYPFIECVTDVHVTIRCSIVNTQGCVGLKTEVLHRVEMVETTRDYR